MNPYGFTGVSVDPSATDMTAMDAIGWDLVTSVPEASTWLMMLAGMGFVGRVARRRAAV
jgi:hypothetical protein